MRPLSTVLFALGLLTPSAAAAAPRPLGPGEAAVIGGWSGNAPVLGIALRPLVETAGCRTFGDDAIYLDNHVNDHLTVSRVYRLRPGRYVIAGAQWSEAWYDQYDMVGVSRARGDAWIVDLAPDVVTDLGIWPITSPYRHRFVPGGPDPRGSPGGQAVAHGIAPLVSANWTHAKVAATCDPKTSDAR